ncbi:uncharacterized protein LOC116124267 [Pistacia vera]|uniref:uncharacterized protein LOC116124267 n=1 Tax=Pistacia vera TaxID=55513 RepID=UPI001263048A|nr:uncharacterized protein LOC116124267 [Pistacia vera]
MDAFRKGLIPNRELYKDLTKLGYNTMEDALARAIIQIRWEEDEANRRRLSNVNGSGLGIVLVTPDGEVIQWAIWCGFKCTNNEARYKALIAGLSLAKEIWVTRLEVKSDSQLVVNQLQSTYQGRDSKMTTYVNLVKELQSAFNEFTICQVPKTKNTHFDALSNLGSTL